MKKPSSYQNTPRYFDDAAAEYLEFIKREHPEHFMKSVAESTQRSITYATLGLVAAERADVFVYGELLIQWRDDKNELRRVVPDNMVVVADLEPVVSTNFAIPIQPARPFIVMEYASKGNSRKNYQGSYDKYERELKVPYYLHFVPETQELTLLEFNTRKGKYASVLPDESGLCAIPELDLTVKLLDGWVRFWWKGELLQTVTELKSEHTALLREKADLAREISEKTRLIADRRAELERLRKSTG
jgi:Uma2 family endonuclease